MKHNILIIGAGGREHALADAFSKSKEVETVFVAPGNGGMEHSCEKIKCIPIEVHQFTDLIQFAKEKEVSYTFVGPEGPLAQGIVDVFRWEGLKIVGPNKEAARLESSKVFAKGIMQEANIKTAAYEVFHPGEWEEAQQFLSEQTLPIVVKESGLANGKGVTICQTFEEALQVCKNCLDKKQVSIIVEDYLSGPEFSHFSLVNGEHILHSDWLAITNEPMTMTKVQIRVEWVQYRLCLNRMMR